MNEQTMIDLVNRVADNDKVAPFQNGFVVLTNEEMVKFAELIAGQCIEICKIERSNVNTRRRRAHDEIEYIKCIEAGSTCDIINMEIWKAFIK